ncbi:MAG: hypothetical protein AB7U20_09155 [Planctomycetaceae bacterium]
MSEFPKSGSLLRRVAQRLLFAQMGDVAYRMSLGLAGLFAAMLLICRLTGLIPDWFSVPAILTLPLLAALGAAMFLRRPSTSDAARRVDAYEGTKDLFLTLTLLDNAAGDYKPLVGRDAEAKAPGVEPTAVVPWRWERRAGQLAAALGLLMAGSLFLPALDPFGQVAAAKEAEARQEELVKNRKATEVRKTQLAKSDLEAETSEDVEKSLEDLKTSLQRMEPQNRQENARVLGTHQKSLGGKWRMGAEQLKDLLSRKPMEQRFGAMSQSQARKWADDVRKGETDGLEEELEDLAKEIENIAQMEDPLQRTEAMRRLQKKLDELMDFAKEDVNSKPLAAALERAMKELEAAKSNPSEKMSAEQRQALAESIKLAELELKQLAQSVRDMQELEQALELMQMAKRLNEEEKLDGEAMEGAQTLEDYRELYAEMMAELGYDLAMLDGEGMPGDGEGLGAGEIEPMADDDSVKTDFEDETSKSAIKKGKILLSLKTKGVSEAEDEEIELQYNAIVSDLKQSLSEAIDQEQIPPGYHEGIKKYFDSLDKRASGGGK